MPIKYIDMKIQLVYDIEIFQGNKHALVVNYWNSTVVVLDIDKRTGAIKSTGKPKSIYDPNQGVCITHINRLCTLVLKCF